jgi:hypothetical protein
MGHALPALARRALHACTERQHVPHAAASGYLVFSMQLGFALLTAGCVRAKSAKSVCLKNIMDAAFGGVGYFLFGEGAMHCLATFDVLLFKYLEEYAIAACAVLAREVPACAHPPVQGRRRFCLGRGSAACC